MSETPINPLRARMIEDMSVRNFGDKTQNDYIRHVKSYAQIRIMCTWDDRTHYRWICA